MASKDVTQNKNKRKATSKIEVIAPAPFPSNVDLQMQSDDESEGEDGAGTSDDGEVDEFPEIDAGSSSEGDVDESESDEDEEQDGSGDENEEDSEDTGTESEDDLHIFPKAKTVISDITGHPKRVYPDIEADYDSDSSTEDAPNRVGNVPMHWYDDLPMTSAFDKKAQADKPLTAEELDIIRRLQENEVPDAQYDPYEPTVEWFTGKGKEEVMPLSAAPEPKRRWVPSKWEKQKVMKIVRAIRQGRIVPSKPQTSSAQPQFYPIWNEEASTHTAPLPAPKPRLPTHSESYNPPEEYLPTDEERAQWEATEKEDRERDFLPQKYGALRLVPAYGQFIQERFGRQLDLYLAPRIQRSYPKLPSPNSLKPFPVYRALQVVHESRRVRGVSVSSDGAGLLWEVMVGKEVKRWKFPGKVGAVEWCPRTDVSFFVVGVEEQLHFVIPPNLPVAILAATQSLLAPATLPPQPATPSPIKWVSTAAAASSSDSPILTINMPSSSGLPKQLVWHRRGDYLSTVSSGEGQGGVWIHQLSRRHSQAPFKKVKGSVQLVLFHPTKPHFFVATQRFVRMYNLAEQKLLKTLTPGIRWISSMDVHPSGDHLIVGGYDRKLCWFDLELSDKPYKILRYHTRALRSLHFHPTYPLFASSSDDGSIQVFHARVYNDLMTNPLIVPLKILRGHAVTEGLGVLQVRWCARQPWLVSAGADGEVAVWCS
ncbi:ribosome biogenesis protein ERB1 [Amylocystis lapponica]|nr:ribosome biogenesis protein ERB1 [Amylocystis lapponica]